MMPEIDKSCLLVARRWPASEAACLDILERIAESEAAKEEIRHIRKMKMILAELREQDGTKMFPIWI